jgi:hypothetical protein
MGDIMKRSNDESDKMVFRSSRFLIKTESYSLIPEKESMDHFHQ